MASRVEIIKNIMRELVDFGSGVNDTEITENLEQIYNRLDFAKKCLEDGVDPNNKKCTVRMVGLYILKCWRITAKPDFNKHLVKTIPRQYRKLLGVFNKIDKLANNTLSYEYKKLKKAELQVDKIVPFLDKLEKNLGLAGEKEPDSTKSEFFTAKSSEMKELESCLSDARDLQGSLVSQQEIVDKASNLWGDLEMIDWDEYYTGEDKHPIYVIKDLVRRYPELLKNYMVKKFNPKKKSKKIGGTNESNIHDKMKEDVVHLDYGKRKKNFQLSKKGKAGAKPSLPEELLQKAKSRGTITHKGNKVPKKAVKFGPSKKNQKLPPIHRDPGSKPVDPKSSKKKVPEQPEKARQKALSPEPVKPVATHIPEKEKEPAVAKKQVKEAVSAIPVSVKGKTQIKKTPEKKADVTKTPKPITEKKKADVMKTPKPITEKKKVDVMKTPKPIAREKKADVTKTPKPIAEKKKIETPTPKQKVKPKAELVKPRSVQKPAPKKIEEKKPEKPEKQPETAAKTPSPGKKREDVFDIEGLKLKSPVVEPMEKDDKSELTQLLPQNEADETQILPPDTLRNLMGDQSDETQLLPTGGFPPPPKLGGKEKRRTWLGAAVKNGIKPTPTTVPVRMNDDLEEEETEDSTATYKEGLKNGDEDGSETFPGIHKETDLPPAEYTDEEKAKLISQMEDAGTMAKKKGCLPFIVGMGSFLIFVIYAIFRLF